MDEIIKFENTAIARHVEDLDKDMMGFISNSKSPNTVRAYKKDWSDFRTWCQLYNFKPLPATPKTVGRYISALAKAEKKVSTIQRRLAAISQAHQAAGLATPTLDFLIRSTLKGIRATKRVAPHKKEPLLTPDIQQMVQRLPNTKKGLRDRALLLVGFAGAFRRSELVALDLEDIRFTREGLTVLIRQSKTDQEGEGQKIAIAYGSNPQSCPVRTLEDWITAANLTKGALFRRCNRWDQVMPGRLGDKMVALIVKDAARQIGLNEEDYAGHSLRAGFATSAAKNGATESSIMKTTRHRSLTVLRGYIRDGNLFNDNASTKLGL